jgi:hypothetical protein
MRSSAVDRFGTSVTTGHGIPARLQTTHTPQFVEPWSGSATSVASVGAAT